MPTLNIGVISGANNTGLDNASVFVRDVNPKLFYLEAFKYPAVTALFTQGLAVAFKDDGTYQISGTQIKKNPTTHPKFEHTESELLKFAFNPTAAIATGDVSISLSTSDDDYFIANDEILLTNAAGQKEVVRVTVVGSGTLTVTRNIGSTGAIALATSDYFYRMGNVRSEDSTSGSPRQAKSETLYNYVEFMTESYGNSLIAQATANYHGNDFQRKKMEALSRMKRQLEIMFWFGVRSLDSSTTNPIYHNGGAFYWLETQYTDVSITDAGGILTKQAWEQWLADALKYNSSEKWVFCSSAVLTAVTGFASNQLRPTDVNLKKFGMAIVDYQSPFGVVHLVREPLFDEVALTNGYAVCLDLNNVSWRYLEGNGVNLDMKSTDMIQENDRSGRKGEWSVTGGFDFAVGKSHAVLKNVQA